MFNCFGKQKKKKKNTAKVPITFNDFLKRKKVALPHKRTVRLALPKQPRKKHSVLVQLLELKRQKNAQIFRELANVKQKKPPNNVKSYLKGKKVKLPSKRVSELAAPKMQRKKFADHLADLELKREKNKKYWKAKLNPSLAEKFIGLFKPKTCPKRIRHLARKQPRYCVYNFQTNLISI